MVLRLWYPECVIGPGAFTDRFLTIVRNDMELLLDSRVEEGGARSAPPSSTLPFFNTICHPER